MFGRKRAKGSSPLITLGGISDSRISLPSSSIIPVYNREVNDAAWSWHQNDTTVYDPVTLRTYVGTVDPETGTQWVNVFSRAGDFELKVQVNTGFPADDHNAPALMISGGALYVGYTGHNDGTDLFVKVSTDTTPENLGVTTTIDNTGTTTYAQFVVLSNTIYIASRSGVSDWRLHELTAPGVWTETTLAATSGNQTYINLKSTGSALRVVQWNHPTSATEPSLGEWRVREFQPGDAVVNISAMGLIVDPGAGRSTRVLDFSADGGAVLYVDFEIGVTTGQTYKVARWSGVGNYDNPAEWSIETVETNDYAFWSDSNYVPGACFANAEATEVWACCAAVSGQTDLKHVKKSDVTWNATIVVQSDLPLVRPVVDVTTKGQVSVHRLEDYTTFTNLTANHYRFYRYESVTEADFSFTATETEVWVGAGQSNRIGRATATIPAAWPEGQIYQYKQNGSIELLTTQTVLDHIVGVDTSEVGFDIQWAIDWAVDNPTKALVIVPCAQGATGFDSGHWVDGGSLYLTAVARSDAAVVAVNASALPSVTGVTGVTWHVGENDAAAGQTAVDELEARIVATVTAMREDATSMTATTPMIFGELGSPVGLEVDVNLILGNIPNVVLHTATVVAADLTLFDTQHFTEASYYTLGSRYYAAISDAIENDSLAPPDTVISVDDYAYSDFPVIVEKDFATVQIPVTGTYTGDVPTDVRARVLLEGGSEYRSLAGVTNLVAADGLWSAIVIAIPSNGRYLTEVRLGANGTVATQTTPFRTCGLFVGNGQSNFINGLTDSTDYVLPRSDIFVHRRDQNDRSTIIYENPTGAGVNTVLNGLALATGISWVCVAGGQGATKIREFDNDVTTGSGSLSLITELVADVSQFGKLPHVAQWVQGEGDAVSNVVGEDFTTYYETPFNEIWATLLTSLGSSTPGDLPVFISSLATHYDGVTDYTAWSTVDAWHIRLAEENPHYYWGGSNKSIPRNDAFHYFPSGYAAQGERVLQSMLAYLGLTTAFGQFKIASAVVVDATTTDVVLTHGQGDDFTVQEVIGGQEALGANTTIISGFEVNGVSATGVKVNATTIRLTHSSLGLTGRTLEHLTGENPNTSGVVVDNSPGQVSLLTTALTPATVTDLVVSSGTEATFASQTIEVPASGTGDVFTPVLTLSGASRFLYSIQFQKERTISSFTVNGVEANLLTYIDAQQSDGSGVQNLTKFPRTYIYETDQIGECSIVLAGGQYNSATYGVTLTEAAGVSGAWSLGESVTAMPDNVGDQTLEHTPLTLDIDGIVCGITTASFDASDLSSYVSASETESYSVNFGGSKAVIATAISDGTEKTYSVTYPSAVGHHSSAILSIAPLKESGAVFHTIFGSDNLTSVDLVNGGVPTFLAAHTVAANHIVSDVEGMDNGIDTGVLETADQTVCMVIRKPAGNVTVGGTLQSSGDDPNAGISCYINGDAVRFTWRGNSARTVGSNLAATGNAGSNFLFVAWSKAANGDFVYFVGGAGGHTWIDNTETVANVSTRTIGLANKGFNTTSYDEPLEIAETIILDDFSTALEIIDIYDNSVVRLAGRVIID